MCGIFGHVLPFPFNSRDSVLQALQGRGPDDWGEYSQVVHLQHDGPTYHLGLLHTRLSIIELSKRGHQPMESSCGRYVLVYNGEIYNFIELRKELEQLGFRFLSHSDSEVLLNSYIAWGKEALTRLNGIFAFAIWDKKLEELFLARDPFGVKPLLYFQQEKSFVFSSELAPMLVSGLISRPSISQEGLNSYLQFGSVLGPNTIIHGVKSLLPGNYAVWRKGHLIQRPFWDLSQVDLGGKDHSYADALKLIKEQLHRSVSWQMRSDVPVGVFLSGGLDSGLITALAAANTSMPLKTFSIGFKDAAGKSMDESLLARITADKFQCDHHQVMIGREDFLESLDDFIMAIDQPSVDGLNSYFVSKATHRKVKVVLSGLGGDEFFAGYPIFHDAMRAQAQYFNLNLLPSATLLKKILQKYQRRHLSFDLQNPWKEFLSYRADDPRALKSIPGKETALATGATLDLIQKLTYFEAKYYMGPTLLRDMDAVSMHHSLEVRVPFLDTQLATLAFSLPAKFKYQGGRHTQAFNKPLLVNAFKDILPPEIIHQPKRGFQLPMGDWIRQGLNPQLAPLLDSLTSLGPSVLAAPIKRAFKKFSTKPAHYLPLWKYLLLELWIKKHSIQNVKDESSFF